MKRLTVLSSAWASLAATICLLAAPAHADTMTKHQCVEANTKGQELLIAGKLTEARALFHSCSVSMCPQLVQNDCTKRLDELDALQPAIIFEVKDASGSDLSAVTVTVDGAPLAQKLDGTPLRVDPGEHTFVFTAGGLPPLTKTFVLAERDQTRHEHITLAPPSGTASSPLPSPAPQTHPSAPVPTVEPEHQARGISTIQVAGIVTGSVGVVGLGLGIVFASLAGSAGAQQAADCGAPPAACTNRSEALSEHSTYTTDTGLEVAAFVAGGALLAAGVVMFVAGAHRAQPDGSGISLVLSPSFSREGGGLAVLGAF